MGAPWLEEILHRWLKPCQKVGEAIYQAQDFATIHLLWLYEQETAITQPPHLRVLAAEPLF